MANSNTSDGISIGIPLVIFIVFLVLKCTHLIDWSWWWVTAPLWIPFVAITLIWIIGWIIFILARLFSRKRQ